jgi:hypothetical protein
MYAPLSATVVPSVLCIGCANASAAADGAIEDERRADAVLHVRARHEADCAVWDARLSDAVDHLRRERDRFKLLLLAMHYLLADVKHEAWKGDGRGTSRWTTYECAHAEALSSVLPDLWPTPDAVDLNKTPPVWDSASLASWFAIQARRQSVPLREEAWTSRDFFGTKWKKGWSLPGGAVTTAGKNAYGADLPARSLAAMATVLELTDRPPVGLRPV